MVFRFLKNTLNLGILTHGTVAYSELHAELFENLFPPTTEKSGENYDLLYQNLISKNQDDLEH